jgi:hypothetical protein
MSAPSEYLINSTDPTVELVYLIYEQYGIGLERRL